MKLFVAFALLALLFGPSLAAEPKIRFVFSIDQGFGNGIVANGNVEALNRMVAALEPLRGKYEVSVLLNPMIKDKQRLKLALDSLVKLKMPFVLEKSKLPTMRSATMSVAPGTSRRSCSIWRPIFSASASGPMMHCAGRRRSGWRCWRDRGW